MNKARHILPSKPARSLVEKKEAPEGLNPSGAES
jgi:hypothetical protein